MFGFRRYHEGDTCPDCCKGKLEHGTAVSITTLWRRREWLRCDRHPRCGFATRRIARDPAAANDNAVRLFGR